MFRFRVYSTEISLKKCFSSTSRTTTSESMGSSASSVFCSAMKARNSKSMRLIKKLSSRHAPNAPESISNPSINSNSFVKTTSVIQTVYHEEIGWAWIIFLYLGKGNMGSSTLRISFEKLFKQGFTLSNRAYHLLASGPSNTEIPSLRIRAFNLDPSNRVTYSVRDPEMAKLFAVDPQGQFRITASRLTREQSYFMNGTFNVEIGIVDLYGHSDVVTVVVQLSEVLKNVQCPKIVESAMCRFSINRTTFDPSITIQ